MVNCGDTKSFLARDGKVFCETIDHKPENEYEKERIHRTGGFLKNGRINGKLNVSRAFGDFALKMNQTPLSLASFQIHQKDQPVICEPDIQILGSVSLFIECIFCSKYPFWPWKWWYANQKPIKERSSTDNFVILGCDGIFDVLNSTQLLQMTFGKWCFYIIEGFKDFYLHFRPQLEPFSPSRLWSPESCRPSFVAPWKTLVLDPVSGSHLCSVQ